MSFSDEGRKKVFVSYSHSDIEWLGRLQVHLKDLERRGLVELWDDTKIQAGAHWREEINNALNSARVAVLLISADFIDSDFIYYNELPPLLAAAETDGTVIIPLIISPSSFEDNENLSRFQSINPPSKPLIGLHKVEQERYFVQLRKAVLQAIKVSTETIPSPLQLRDRRPSRDIPPDYQPILFTDLHTPDGNLSPLPELMYDSRLGGFPAASCVVAHFQQDVEIALKEIEETIVTFQEPAAPNQQQSVWIPGDELWHSPYTDQPGKLRDDEAVLRLLCPRGVSLDEFSDEFEHYLDKADSVFLLDFSRLTLNDLYISQGSGQDARRATVVQAIMAFVRHLIGRSQRVVIGLPRLALGRREWREFIEIASTCWVACDLFSAAVRSTEASSPPCAGTVWAPLPDLLRDALDALLPTNSYALTAWLRRELGALETRMGGRPVSTEQQLRALLNVASRLQAGGFFEPAYRLEAWCRTWQRPEDSLSLQVVIRPDSAKTSRVYGRLRSLLDLPQVADRIILTGDSGQGKTTSLQYLEHHWSLPHRSPSGRHCPAWLPILFAESPESGRPLSDQLRQASQATLPDTGVDVSLLAHTQLSRIVSGENIGWLFSSPILYLLDGLANFKDGQEAGTWVEEILSSPYLDLGIIASYRNIEQAPRKQAWFKRAFEAAVEANLRHLELEEAQQLCSNEKLKKILKDLYYRIEEPLNTHLRSPFLIRCLNAIGSSFSLAPGSNLFEFVEAYVRSRLGGASRDEEALDVQLPRLAFALHTGKSLEVSSESINLGIHHQLLSDGSQPQFAHPILSDFFLARYLCRQWSQAGPAFLDSIPKELNEQWDNSHLNLLRMVASVLPADRRGEVFEALRQRGHLQLAHRCLLDLRPEAYSDAPEAAEIASALVALLRSPSTRQYTTPEGKDIWKKKCEAAYALGHYDPRIPRLDAPTAGFVQIRNDERGSLYVGQYPVTNLEFSRFLREGGYGNEGMRFWHSGGWEWREANRITAPAYWGGVDHVHPNCPVVGVSFHEALAYTRWLNAHLGVGKEEQGGFALPTQLEWALFTGISNNQLGSNDCSIQPAIQDIEAEVQKLEKQLRDLIAKIQEQVLSTPPNVWAYPVGLFPPSERGVYDLYGNVWQWCDEWFTDIEEPPSTNTKLTAPPILVTGGPVSGVKRDALSLLWGGLDPFSRADNVGFRLVYRSIQSYWPPEPKHV